MPMDCLNAGKHVHRGFLIEHQNHHTFLPYPLTGFPAWSTWLGVHLLSLIGFRNRLIVLLNWAWDYFLYAKAVRLILPGPPHIPRLKAG